MRKKVYISSTYKDLVLYRNALLDMFRFKGLQDEYEIVSMEGYVSENQISTLEVCLNDVSRVDIYILILAKRYGSVINIDGRRISYTEAEYEQALEMVKLKRGYRIFVFWSNDRTEKEDFSSFPELENSFLIKFYERAKSENACFIHPFTTPDNLCKQILLTLNYSFKRKYSSTDFKENLLTLNRENPSSLFKNKFKKKVNSFYFSADNENCPNDFVKRIFQIDLHRTEHPKCDISLSQLNTLNKDKFEIFFSGKLEKALSIDVEEYNFTGQERFFLNLEISDIEIRNGNKMNLIYDLLLKFLPSFLLQPDGKTSSNIFFMFFSYEDEDKESFKRFEFFVKKLQNSLKIDDCLYDIEELGDVLKDDIREWLDYNISHNFIENDLDDILKDEVSNLSKRTSFKMKNVNELIIKWLDKNYDN